MKDIEVKRKELETAKRIRDNGYKCQKEISCWADNCPACGTSGLCLQLDNVDWDSFISTREAELVEMEKGENTQDRFQTATHSDGLSHVQTAPHDDLTHEERIKKFTGGTVYEVHQTAPVPTIDAFVFALIEGGYYRYGEINLLFNDAAALKAESDRRRHD